jgi:putative ABC transport system substrate-binding protein
MAQKAARRVAILSAFVDAGRQGHLGTFRQALAEAGWAQGSMLHVDYRSAEGDASRLRGLAEELVRSQPDVILAMATPALVAARAVTRSIPIVFVNVSDPVDGGFVESMARPGGNVTGFTSFEYSVGGKWVELVKEVAPGLERVLVMLNKQNYTSRALLRTIEATAPSFSIAVRPADIRSAADVQLAVETFVSVPGGAVIVLPDPATTTARAQIVALAIKHRLPSVQAFSHFAIDGGLMAYGADDLDLYRRAGGYVARILNGAHPRDLPVQNPTRYQLTVNLKTAKAMGLTISESFLLRADEVIE